MPQPLKIETETEVRALCKIALQAVEDELGAIIADKGVFMLCQLITRYALRFAAGLNPDLGEQIIPSAEIEAAEHRLRQQIQLN